MFRLIEVPRVPWLALLPVSATLAVYLPVLHSALGFDELIHLYNLTNFGALELLVRPHGGHLLFFSNLSYWVLYDLFGLQTQAYYGLALITHLANVALCYLVIAELTGRPAVAALSATVWGSAAVNAGAVEWFAVYGQVLLSTIVLWMLYDVARLAAAGRTATTRTSVRWIILLVAAGGSFGYGLVIAALWFAVVSLMLDDPVSWRRVLVRCAWSSFAVAILYVAVQRLHAATSGRAAASGIDVVAARLPGLSWSDVTFGVRAIVGFATYGIATLFPGPLLYTTAAGQVGVGPLQGLPAARAAVACSIAALVWLVVFVAWLRRQPGRPPRQALGLVALALGCYAVAATWFAGSGRLLIASGGQWPLTPLFQIMAPRYHYLPPLLLMIATMRVLPSWHQATRGMRAAVNGALLMWVASAAVLDGIAVRSNPKEWRFSEVGIQRWLGDAVRGFPPGSAVYVDNGRVLVKNETLPGVAAIALLLFPDQRVDGRLVYFVEPDGELLQRLRAMGDTPIGRAVVAPGEVPMGAHYYRPSAVPRERAAGEPSR